MANVEQNFAQLRRFAETADRNALDEFPPFVVRGASGRKRRFALT
jgi:hypothetical protein